MEGRWGADGASATVGPAGEAPLVDLARGAEGAVVAARESGRGSVATELVDSVLSIFFFLKNSRVVGFLSGGGRVAAPGCGGVQPNKALPCKAQHSRQRVTCEYQSDRRRRACKAAEMTCGQQASATSHKQLGTIITQFRGLLFRCPNCPSARRDAGRLDVSPVGAPIVRPAYDAVSRGISNFRISEHGGHSVG